MQNGIILPNVLSMSRRGGYFPLSLRRPGNRRTRKLEYVAGYRFTSQPQSHHRVALQRLLRYVKATQYRRVTYRSGQLIGCTDANFGGSVVTDAAGRPGGAIAAET
jgi:hypothetical protein